MSLRPISEDELLAYADGRLDATRRAEVEAWLAERPDLRARVNAWQEQNRLLHRTFDTVVDEPVPARLVEAAMRRPRFSPPRLAAVVAWLAIGGAIGFVVRGAYGPEAARSEASLPRQAALAHAVYSPEVRHPVEVTAEQESHLITWLSKRLGTQLKPLRLVEAGFELIGGRLLPGEAGPVAQFMYQDARGQRLTLYVRTGAMDNRETAFRYAQEGKIGVFYWLDGQLGYALSEEMQKNDLLRLANVVYRQLNP